MPIQSRPLTDQSAAGFSPETDSPHSFLSAEKEADSTGIQLVFVVAGILLLFALGFLIVYPTQEKPAYSELFWTAPPVLAVDGNGFVLTFGVRVNSMERTSIDYHLDVDIEGSLALVKDFALAPGQDQTIDFRIPINGNFQAKNELRVTLTRAGADDDDKPRQTLEILDWFALPDSNS